ncbi:amidohydrolase [Frankia sp. CNm7]|uniref:Amidohydrolase n=1 Tax=Frankia nepalensis TaxID=1836974 RepID=A0A937RKX6_9ACTN|nr:amidohydrolase family protein [Frankia nepalensis]MBL7498984.1 amidohydrolase [Frankia nepalensis]MBL7511496.1 amidohydrolase [Frankia nepalensis]MBL7520712.1 amidohydrolase [Frankia nepalensis]MBL7630739.1 amidohydrolase [Frankia nepalensis]
MTRPRDVKVIDTLMGFRSTSNIPRIAGLRDRGRADNTIGYMFKDMPANRPGDVSDEQAIDETLAKMDTHGIELALVNLTSETARTALRKHPARFAASLGVDPNDVMGAVRAIRQAVDEYGLRAVTLFPSGVSPRVPIDDRRAYPIYATCVELGLPVFVAVGVPGPRVPMAAQRVELVDQVCYDFPELRFVMRHGAEPWVNLAVKLMLKWPNLYYSTTAFAPKHYPKAIIDYANTRGADKIIYGGYYPFGIELERTFTELDTVPFKADVWPKFLRHNAATVLDLTPAR